MSYKQMIDSLDFYNNEGYLMYNNKPKIYNEWFFRQLKSFLNPKDYENFVKKGISLKDLSKDSLLLTKYMINKASKEMETYCGLGNYTRLIHAIVVLYNKFGKNLYNYKKRFLVHDIQILTRDILIDRIEETIQKIPSFYGYKAAMLTYRMDENESFARYYMGIDGYFQFIIEDEEEGIKALNNGWRNFKLWKFYRKLEKQRKIPVYKDEEVEENLWYSKKHSDCTFKFEDLDKIETISPMDETIAKNIATGVGKFSSVLLAYHVYGVFETASKLCGFNALHMHNKVPKKVLSELFRNGLSLNDYIKKEIISITKDYDTPGWWDLTFFVIPVVWEDWILVEWLLQKLRTSFKSMVKTRVHYVHGTKLKYNYFRKLDEITPEDLTNGIKTSPSVAFKNSEERLRRLRMDEEKNIELPISPFKETESVKQLKCSFDFIEESKFMNNCVSGYINSAKYGSCFIYHVESSDHHGTMEIDKHGSVVQLYSIHNEDPEPEVMYAVAEWLKVNNLEVSEVIKEWRATLDNDQKSKFDEVYSN